MNEEYLNNLKKMDQERREAILKNHKQSKSPAPIRKPAETHCTKDAPTCRVPRSQT